MPPIEYDEFGFIVEGTDQEEPAQGKMQEPEIMEPVVPIRSQFPADGSDYLGGKSNGWEYRTVFAGGRLETSYSMVLDFMKEHGYGDVPVPADAAELKFFRKQRTAQLQLFPERGYAHNPVKILFHPEARMRNALILCLYNEQYPHHLLLFHGIRLPKTQNAGTNPGSGAAE